jgi:hypothetical protein
VQTALVSVSTGRLLNREVESVPLCQAHIAHADKRGQLIVDYSNA